MPINREQFKDLVKRVLEEAHLYSQEAVELLLGTAAVESRFGTYIKQIQGPAKGVFQMEKETFDWLKEKYKKQFPYIDKPFESLEYDLKLAIIMCRLRYLVSPLPIPKTLLEQSRYWKHIYNTKLGKGVPEEYLRMYKKFAA